MTTPLAAASPSREDAARAAIHPVASEAAMRHWLSRVPRTNDYPPDFETTLRGQGSAFLVEMSSAPGCLPCGDLWGKFGKLRARFGVAVRTIDEKEAMLRSGRFGLPWIGHPVAWLRPVGDSNRLIPIAIGTDLEANLARNIYLGIKMQTGVRPAVGVRAMAKFTGIVGAATTRPSTKGRKD
ncbi:hypothetical protein [Sphingobium olei]|uniref:Uncharacterized protein n=1 Tax=Sphingobium olei TaxID=420955 RepID=A0ABW3NU00_9SPHN